MPEPNRSKHDEYLKNYFTKEQQDIVGFSRETVAQRKDGSTFPMDLAVSAMRVDDQVFFTGIVRDVTFRKEAEKAVAENRLHHLHKLEALGQMAGGVAHEFNNMLVPIIGLTELVRENLSVESPDHANLGIVLNAAIGARSLVKQILSFAHMRNRVIKPLLLSNVVNAAVAMMKPMLPSSVQMTVRIQDKKLLVNCDDTEIQQIIINLGKNAIDAMGMAGGTLDIDIYALDFGEPRVCGEIVLEAGTYAVLQLSDTGGGIQPEILPQIFDPFFSTKEIGEGTGMGLSVIYSIVRDYGGGILVSSEIGAGTCFQIFLPIVAHVDLTPESAIQPGPLQ